MTTSYKSAPAAGSEPLGEHPSARRRSLEEAYAGSLPYQWAIELWRNFAQVLLRTVGKLRGDEKQVFDMLNFHRKPITTGRGKKAITTLALTGALKRAIWNTAEHMSWDEIENYFTQTGTGHGDMWSLDNPEGDRHAGAREMLLPQNPAGVVVLSYHPTDLPDGAMVWMFQDPKTKEYRLKSMFIGLDFDGDPEFSTVAPLGLDEFGLDWRTVLPADLKRKGGVMFALLGHDIYADDLDGVDSNSPIKGRKEAATGLATELADRVAEVNGKVTVVYRVAASESKPRINKTASDGKVVGYDSRNIYGAEGWYTKYRPVKTLPHQSGVWVSTSGLFEVEWTLLDEVQTAGNFNPYRGLGHVVARYRDEFLPTPPVGNQRKRAAAWGVPFHTVADRLALHVRPVSDPTARADAWHVIQDGASRSDLKVSGAGRIPWDEWQEEFAENLPDPIQAAIDVARAESMVLDEDQAKRLIQRIKTRLRGSLGGLTEILTLGEEATPEEGATLVAGEPVESPPVGPPGPPHPPTPPGPGPTVVPGVPPGPDEDPTHKEGPKRKQSQDLPLPRWLTADEWADECGDPDHTRFVRLVRAGKSYSLWFNMGHAIYVDQVVYYTGEWLRSRRGAVRRLSAIDVTDSIQNAYWLDSVGRIFASSKRLGGIGKVFKRAEEDEQLLTIGADGFSNVDQLIQTDLGGKASGASFKSAS